MSYIFVCLLSSCDDLHSLLTVNTSLSNIRHEDFSPSSSFVTLVLPPLDSEMGWTGELWSNSVFLILEN